MTLSLNDPGRMLYVAPGTAARMAEILPQDILDRVFVNEMVKEGDVVSFSMDDLAEKAGAVE